ncbi:hypothetical protein D2V08_13925 [Flagellimonas lutimaris]|uniref:Uncharacterized protein n=1 Tax=Flagellimonas lutimaris TaxID=475082 RepID=A0A3A1N567_9FLAO|nr:hypothetical protein [Allomuricauda lutimaris]RIV31539.1 hypothetical protein D2V08_13925 [Allomuricauda lutimaris]
MDLIISNPYRIAGILSNASEREIQKQKTKIKAYSRVGKEVQTEYDFKFLDDVNRNEEIIERAFAKVEQNSDKVKHALFWFLNANPLDQTALEYLKDGDEYKAQEIWKKVTDGKEINVKNYSAFNNVGTCHLMSSFKIDIKKGIEAKLKLIESDYFENFVHEVADKTYSIDSQKQVEIFVDELLDELLPLYSDHEINQLFNGCNSFVRKYLTSKLTEGPIHIIETAIETTKIKRRDNRSIAYQHGLTLYTGNLNDINALKSMLGTNDLKYKMLADNMANEIAQCGIDYFKANKDLSDPSEKGLELLRYAQSIAVGDQTCDRLVENIEGIQEWSKTAPIKDDLNFITERLKVFQNLADTIANAKKLMLDCKPKLDRIKNILGPQDQLYLNVSGAVVNNALGMIIDIVNEAQSGLEYDRAKLMRLPNIVSSAIVVVRGLGTLDMDGPTRRRYSDNKATILSIESQLRSINGQSNYRSPSPGTSSSSDDGCAPWVYIVGGIILLIILANTCS